VNALRWQSAIAHGGALLWQLYSASVAWRAGAILEKLLHNMGAEVGPGITLFLVTSRYWVIVPAVFAVLSFVSIRKIETKPRFAVAVLAAEILVALILNIWWRESFFGPLFSLMGKVG
jgi:hypothetical protein